MPRYDSKGNVIDDIIDINAIDEEGAPAANSEITYSIGKYKYRNLNVTPMQARDWLEDREAFEQADDNTRFSYFITWLLPERIMMSKVEPFAISSLQLKYLESQMKDDKEFVELIDGIVKDTYKPSYYFSYRDELRSALIPDLMKKTLSAEDVSTARETVKDFLVEHKKNREDELKRKQRLQAIEEKKAFLDGIEKIKKQVADNENLDDEEKKALLSGIDEAAKGKSKQSDLTVIAKDVEDKVSVYEHQKLAEDKKKKAKEKKDNENIWLAASMDKQKEQEMSLIKDKEKELKKKKKSQKVKTDEDVVEEEKQSVSEIRNQSIDNNDYEEPKRSAVVKAIDENVEKNKVSSVVELREEDKVIGDEILDEREFDRAKKFVDNVAAYNVIKVGIVSWVSDVVGKIDKIDKAKKNKDSRSAKDDIYKVIRKSAKKLKSLLDSDSSKPDDIETELYKLNTSAKMYKGNSSSNDMEGNDMIMLADIIIGKADVSKNLFHNARTALGSEADSKGTLYANLSSGRINSHAEELKAKYNIIGSDKNFDFEKLSLVSKAQLELRKKIKKVSVTLEKNYNYAKSKNAYLTVKRNAKASDIARYYVLSNYLDKAYNPSNCVSDSDDDLAKVKEVNEKFNVKNVKKEIEYLSKNSLFAKYLKMHGDKALSEWHKVERQSDKLKEEYSNILEEMGGKDYNRLAEYASNLRELVGDQINAENKKEIADSICNNVGKIMALQIMTDPKSRVVLNGAALDLKANKDRLKDLSESIATYLKNKNYFNFEAGAANDAKCTAKIIDVLKSSRMKSNVMKEFNRLSKDNNNLSMNNAQNKAEADKSKSKKPVVKQANPVKAGKK